jgi:hypothetical protein
MLSRKSPRTCEPREVGVVLERLVRPAVAVGAVWRPPVEDLNQVEALVCSHINEGLVHRAVLVEVVESCRPPPREIPDSVST